MEEQVASVTSTIQATTGDSTVAPHDRAIEPFLNELARRQCALLEAVATVVLLRPTREHPMGLTAKFLDGSTLRLTPRDYRRLAELATRATRDNRSLMEPFHASGGLLSDRPEYRLLATPLRLHNQPLGASVALVPESSEPEIRERLTRLELSGMLLEAYLWRQQAYSETAAKIQLRETLDLLDVSNQGHDATEMASLFCHELQRRFGCTRVSIGLVHGHAIRVVAMSGTEQMDRRSELAEALDALMEECADQDTEIRYPQPEDVDPAERRVVRAHAALSERFGPSAIASFPLRVDEGLIGVAVLERDPADPFNDNTLRLLRLVAEYMGPNLWTRRMADRGVLAVTRDRLIDLGHAMVGPEKTAAKLVAATLLLLLLIAFVVPVPDRVKGVGRLVADQRRQVSTPYVGTIEEVYVKPGDYVDAGQALLRLETDATELELLKKQSELRSARTRADEARSRPEQGHLAEAKMIDAQIAGLEADIRLLQDMLDEATIVAPISGTITQGNLEDVIGKVVQPADPLLEIAQLDTITALAFVPEDSVTRVKPGQRGVLALTSRPSEGLEFEVERVTPASEMLQQRNVYRVELKLLERPEWLRPGMEGQARIYGETTNLATVYGRPMINAIRMRLWW